MIPSNWTFVEVHFTIEELNPLYGVYFNSTPEMITWLQKYRIDYRVEYDSQSRYHNIMLYCKVYIPKISNGEVLEFIFSHRNKDDTIMWFNNGTGLIEFWDGDKISKFKYKSIIHQHHLPPLYGHI